MPEPKEDVATAMPDFMKENYPAEPETPAPAGEEKPPAGEEKPPAGEEKPPASNLPPELLADKPLETPPDETTVDLDHIDKILETPDLKDDIRKNMGNMRKMLGSNKDSMEKHTAQMNLLREAGVIDEAGEIINGQSSKEAQEALTKAYDELGALSLEHDPRFRTQFNDPILRQEAQIVEMLKGDAEKDDEAKMILRKAVGMNATDRMNFLKDVAPENAAYISQYFTPLDGMYRSRAQALEDHKSTADRMQEATIVDEQQRVDQLRNTLKSTSLTKLTKEGYAIFEKIPGNDAFNGWVDKIVGTVDDLFASTNIEVQSEAMALSVAAPVYKQMYEGTKAKLDAANVELAKYKAIAPGHAGNGEENALSQGAPDGADIKSNEGLAKMIAAAAQSRG